MKKVSVKKGAACMACLECVRACSQAFYKEFHQDKACIQVVEKNGAPKPLTCIQCGKCAKACEAGAITQNPKTGVYMINKKLCTGCRKMQRRSAPSMSSFPLPFPAARQASALPVASA